MKTLLCQLAGCLLTIPAPAQSPPGNVPVSTAKLPRVDAPRVDAPRVDAPRVVLKLAPLTLFEFQNTAEVGAEVQLTDRFSLQGQVGYAPDWLIWKSSSTTLATRYANRENWRGRLETRWYVGPTRRGTNPRHDGFPLGRYLAVDVLYKQLNASETLTIGRQCAGFNCAYFERVNNRVSRYVLGLGAKFGAQYALGYNRDGDRPRWLLDTYLGVGVRRSWTERPATTRPGDQVFDVGGEFLVIDPFEATNYLLPTLLLGLKLGYAL